jgi:tetratricopeptide (TPR) repeat protein
MRNICVLSGCVLIGIILSAGGSSGQAAPPNWQAEVRGYADKQDWDAAMRVVEAEIARFPQDMDLRAWRARVLTWSGRLDQAEQEYLHILAVVPNDPDNWMGLASVYSRQKRSQDALQALDRGIALDPKRADLHLARGRALRALNRGREAGAEFEQALLLDPRNHDARSGIASLRSQPRHQLLFGTNTDLFSFSTAEQQEEISLNSRWTSRWETSAGASFYRWLGVDAQKFKASFTGKSARWGSLTVGGAVAHDRGLVPQNEAFFAYGRGWRLANTGLLRGLETNYEQHWFWYSTARVLTLNETTIAYFPRDWTWSLRLTGAGSHFPGTAEEWRPAGFSKIAFALKRFESRQLGGNIFFATGTENYSQVDQIGHFSSHTYGGGLHYQLAEAQEINGFAGYEKRTEDLAQITFGLTYGIRF